MVVVVGGAMALSSVAILPTKGSHQTSPEKAAANASRVKLIKYEISLTNQHLVNWV